LATLIHRGAFNAHDVIMTRKSLMAFAFGLPSFMLVKILASSFYSAQNIKTPVKFAFVALVANLILNALLIIPLKHVGLALATALASWLNAGLLWVGLKNRNQLLPSHRWGWWIPRLLIASALMTLALELYLPALSVWLDWGLAQRLLHLAIAILISMAVYSVLWVLLGLRPRHFHPD
jgi:putative peptidoglycan lipid II flippase